MRSTAEKQGRKGEGRRAIQSPVDVEAKLVDATANKPHVSIPKAAAISHRTTSSSLDSSSFSSSAAISGTRSESTRIYARLLEEPTLTLALQRSLRAESSDCAFWKGGVEGVVMVGHISFVDEFGWFDGLRARRLAWGFCSDKDDWNSSSGNDQLSSFMKLLGCEAFVLACLCHE
ncbi:hypothetical protein DL98DRAFT_531138 [Cadophora sp. DSE1049]|nr:hypothetical protein DL98DRAFT_531138 [Cadophora sp. DSE1049]